MISLSQAASLALTYEEATEAPHFEKRSFRIKGKIFLTLDSALHRACVKLSPSDQDAFSLMDKTIIYPIPNKWGQQGWTFVELKKVKPVVFKAVLCAAYCHVAPAKLAKKYLP